MINSENGGLCDATAKIIMKNVKLCNVTLLSCVCHVCVELCVSCVLSWVSCVMCGVMGVMCHVWCCLKLRCALHTRSPLRCNP